MLPMRITVQSFEDVYFLLTFDRCLFISTKIRDFTHRTENEASYS